MSAETKKLFYNTTLSQAISSCGQYLFAGNNFGEIFVFSISQICASPDEQGDEDEAKSNKITFKNSLSKPLQVYKTSEDGQHIRSLVYHNNFLIVGTNGIITGYTWYKNRLTKKAWEVRVSANNDSADQQTDINTMWLNKKDGIIYAGCGDNNIYAISLEDGKVVRALNGHTDYIQWVDGGAENNLYSASEDGTVKFWDAREKKPINQIEPYKDERLVRPQFGKWQGTVSVTDDWLICGGGPSAGLWHLRSMECTTIFPFIKPVQVSGFLDDIVYLAGNYNHLCQYNLKGDLTTELPLTSSSVYTVVSQVEPEKLLSIAGSSNCLDICTDFNYKDIVLKLYE